MHKKNPDEEQVTKGAVKDAIDKMHHAHMSELGAALTKSEIKKVVDALPALQPAPATGPDWHPNLTELGIELSKTVCQWWAEEKARLTPESEAEVEDAVSREKVLEKLGQCIRWELTQKELIEEVKKLPAVQPVTDPERSQKAESKGPDWKGRNKNEIQETLNWLEAAAEESEDLASQGPFGAGRLQVEICDHRARMYRACLGFYDWLEGKREWKDVFHHTPSEEKP